MSCTNSRYTNLTNLIKNKKGYTFVPIKEYISDIFINNGNEINEYFVNLCMIKNNRIKCVKQLEDENQDVTIRNIEFQNLLDKFEFIPPPGYTKEHVMGEFGNLNFTNFKKCFKHKIT
jgi:hypothetical protein